LETGTRVARFILQDVLGHLFAKRSDAGPALEYLKTRSWDQATVGKVMLWMAENQASGADGAKWFLKNMPDAWDKWVPADVAAKVKAAL